MGRFGRALEQLLALPEEVRLLGHYQLVRPLGSGGFAPVWLANEIYGGVVLRSVAIKLFGANPDEWGEHEAPSSSGPSSNRSDAALAEARALSRVEHPNVVRFLTIVANVEGTLTGLVMEYLHGESVSAALRQLGRLPMAKVLDVGCAVASALEAVHRAGIIHRDVKPRNVIESAGSYKLIDFGIASAGPHAPPKPMRAEAKPPSGDAPPLHAIDGAPTDDTRAVCSVGDSGESSALISAPGTMGYVDPASLDAPPTPASDLYSLGALLYACLCGAVPAAEAARLARKRGMLRGVLEGTEAPPSILIAAPSTPKALAALVDALVDPDPGKRPASAQAVASQLERMG